MKCSLTTYKPTENVFRGIPSSYCLNIFQKYYSFLTIVLLLFSIPSFSQVGVGTTDPKATLDIRATSQATPSNTDGILIPKVDNFPLTNPTISQDGMMVYATGSGTPTKGFYYWDNGSTCWKPVEGVRKIDDLSDGKSDNDGSENGSSLYLGKDAGLVDNSSDNRNVGVGYQSLYSNIGNVEGRRNTALGYASLYTNTNGSLNTAIGYKVLEKNLSGISNTAIGAESLLVNEGVGINEGSYNTATGSQTLKANTSGSYNTANGVSALSMNNAGQGNTAVGYLALLTNTTGNYNTAVGNGALKILSTGSNNVVIGTTAGELLVTGRRNVLIGRQSGGTGSIFDDRLYIENSASDTPLIGGNFATKRVGINRDITLLSNTFEVGGDASKAVAGSWAANSDRRLKKNIHSIEGGTALEKISKLNGVSYEWNDTKTGMPRPEGIQYGFIAQELMEVFPEKVTMDKMGFYQTAYGDYDAFFVQAIKELKQELDEKEARITDLEKSVNQLESYKANNEKTIELENRLEKLEVLLINKTVSKE